MPFPAFQDRIWYGSHELGRGGGLRVPSAQMRRPPHLRLCTHKSPFLWYPAGDQLHVLPLLCTTLASHVCKPSGGHCPLKCEGLERCNTSHAP